MGYGITVLPFFEDRITGILAASDDSYLTTNVPICNTEGTMMSPRVFI